MYIVKIAEFYDPFTFLWEVMDKRFAAEINASRRMTEAQAREQILARYFQVRWVAGERDIQRLFAWNMDDIQETLPSLQRKGIIVDDLTPKGKKKLWAASKIRLALGYKNF